MSPYQALALAARHYSGTPDPERTLQSVRVVPCPMCLSQQCKLGGLQRLEARCRGLVHLRRVSSAHQRGRRWVQMGTYSSRQESRRLL